MDKQKKHCRCFPFATAGFSKRSMACSNPKQCQQRRKTRALVQSFRPLDHGKGLNRKSFFGNASFHMEGLQLSDSELEDQCERSSRRRNASLKRHEDEPTSPSFAFILCLKLSSNVFFAAEGKLQIGRQPA